MCRPSPHLTQETPAVVGLTTKHRHPTCTHRTFFTNQKSGAMIAKKSCSPTKYVLTLWLATLGTLLHAQHPERVSPPYTLGLSLGTSYQTSDVRIDKGGLGASLWLGREYTSADAPIGFGLRGRLSYSKSLGLDPFPTRAIAQNEALNGSRALDYLDYPDELNVDQGFVWFNHRTDLAELGAEAVFTLNRLRKNTGFHVALYGGYGIDWYDVRYDQADSRMQPYYEPYATLDPNAPQSRILRTLRSQILDGFYETQADGFEGGMGKLEFMPSAGIELGFQLTPHFALVGGHRMTFSGTDLLDGQQWKDPDNDILHYTSLGLQWRIHPKQREKRPTIEMVMPRTSPWTSPWPETEVRARIRHVSSPAGLSCLLNGYPLPFELYGEQFACRVPLQPGRNELVITATNSRGTARQVVVLFWNAPTGLPLPPTSPPPQIEISAPPYDGYETHTPAFTFEATVRHLRHRRQLELWLNDRPVEDFTFRAGRLSANVELHTGRNTFRLRATNEAGTTEQQISVRYTPSWQPPEVRITRPADEVHYTTASRIRLEADIAHVREKDDIRLAINGRNWPRFSFDGRRLRAEIELPAGSTRVRITAHNEAGKAADEVTIVREDLPAQASQPPRIAFVRPDRPAITHDRPHYQIVAQVDHVRAKAQITLTVNGRPVPSFDWDGHTLRKRIALESGDNIVRITAANADGSEAAEVRIRYLRPQLPVVRITEPANDHTTQTAKLRIQAHIAHVQSKDHISLWVNGQRIPSFQFDPSRQRLTAMVGLREGRNTIRIEATNEAGKASDEVRVVRQQAFPPSVRITWPDEDHYRTRKDRLTAKAALQHVRTRSELDIRLNGQPVPDVQFDAKAGALVVPLQLREGDNLLRIAAHTPGGKASDELVITYTPPRPPAITIETPADGTTVKKATLTLRATTTNVPSQRHLSLKLNGQPVKGFSWNARGIVQASLKLRPGDNTIELSATTRDGHASERVRVRYQPPVAPPVVTFVQPARNGLRTDKPAVDIRATIKHVDSPKAVRLYLNGRNLARFQWDSRTQALMATVPLQEGENQIEVSATNEAGTHTDTRLVIYAPPMPEPQVEKPQIHIESLSQPVTNPMNPDKGQSTLIATITGVRKQKQIQLLVNGKPAAFSFQLKGGKLQATFSLQRGKNTIVLQATNEGGTTRIAREITF